MKNKTSIFKIALMLAVISVFFAGCSSKEPPKEKEPEGIPVQVVAPVYSDYSETITLPGVTDAPVTTQVSFLISGNIEQLNFEEGDMVKQGDIMAIIDSKIYQDQLRTAEGHLLVAKANKDVVYAGSRDQEIAMAQAQMLQAKANLEHSRIELDRYAAVYKMDAVPRQQYDQVLNQYKLAEEQYNAAKQQLSLAREGSSKEQKEAAVANVIAAQTQVKQAETQLGYSIIRSPIDGIIARKMMEVGALASPNAAVYEIREIHSMDLKINVPSVHIGKINIGDEASVVFFEFPKDHIRGRVREIQPVADDMTRSFQLKLKLERMPFLKNYSGTIGKATFRPGDKLYGSFFPTSCLMKKQDDQGFFIFIVNEKDEVEKVLVEIDKLKDDNVLIKGRLPENARVIISGQEYVNPGSKVRIVEALNAQKFVTPDKESEPVEINQDI